MTLHFKPRRVVNRVHLLIQLDKLPCLLFSAKTLREPSLVFVLAQLLHVKVCKRTLHTIKLFFLVLKTFKTFLVVIPIFSCSVFGPFYGFLQTMLQNGFFRGACFHLSRGTSFPQVSSRENQSGSTNMFDVCGDFSTEAFSTGSCAWTNTFSLMILQFFSIYFDFSTPIL